MIVQKALEIVGLDQWIVDWLWRTGMLKHTERDSCPSCDSA